MDSTKLLMTAEINRFIAPTLLHGNRQIATPHTPFESPASGSGWRRACPRFSIAAHAPAPPSPDPYSPPIPARRQRNARYGEAGRWSPGRIAGYGIRRRLYVRLWYGWSTARTESSPAPPPPGRSGPARRFPAGRWRTARPEISAAAPYIWQPPTCPRVLSDNPLPPQQTRPRHSPARWWWRWWAGAFPIPGPSAPHPCRSCRPAERPGKARHRIWGGNGPEIPRRWRSRRDQRSLSAGNNPRGSALPTAPGGVPNLPR